MATRETPTTRRGVRRRWDPANRFHIVVDALDHLVGGLGTSVLALATLLLLLGTAALCLVGVGLPLAPAALRMVRVVADRERARLSRRGPEVIGPEPLPGTLRAALRDAAVRRELGWVACHATLGFVLGLAALALPLGFVHDVSFPLWWKLAEGTDGASSTFSLLRADDWPGALLVGLFGLATLAVTLVVMPGMDRLQAWPGTILLAPDRGTDLALRVVALTATRAAALDAHATELRRIERSLHDGTQNRLVAVNVLIGAARRALARDPAGVEEILGRAQDATERALAELRGIVRGILPPVLAERSLPDALSALAADCPVACTIDADVPDRQAVSVEATAYFVVAEALTNITKHSNAERAMIQLRRRDDRLCVDITDDGRGGADERSGSGIAGIRRRVEAHDGTFALTSPAGGPTVLTVSLPCAS